jgi:hypothetical protein
MAPPLRTWDVLEMDWASSPLNCYCLDSMERFDALFLEAGTYRLIDIPEMKLC